MAPPAGDDSRKKMAALVRVSQTLPGAPSTNSRRILEDLVLISRRLTTGLIAGGRGRNCPCGGSRKSHGPAQRRLLTAAGDVTLHRRSLSCRRCGTHAHALDERLGVDGFVSPGAQRLLCLLGAEHSFERSAGLLREVAGLCVCDNTIRKICDEHGGRMRAWQREEPQASQTFRAAQGDVEFQTDGTAVNTTGAGVRSA